MLLESVPNLSEGRDRDAVARVAHAGAAPGAGVWVLDEDLDTDHNRAVVSLCGSPAGLEEALVSMAAAAAERLDLRGHEGVHPRVGTLDVVPLVPLAPSDMPSAIDTARAVGRRIVADLGIPVYFYGDALGGPSLADIRAGRATPDLGGTRPHPRAGFVCVGARPLLVAYNILFPGAPLPAVRALARALRAGGPDGMPGVQALAFSVRGGVPQLSMNLFDLSLAQPRLVLDEVRHRAGRMGLEVGRDEVVGLCPATAAGGVDAARGRVLEARMIAAGLSEAVRELGRTRPGASADEERTLVAVRLMNERRRIITMGVEGEDFLSMAEAAAILPAYIRAAAFEAAAPAAELLLTAARRLRAAVPASVTTRFAKRVQLLDRLLT